MKHTRNLSVPIARAATDCGDVEKCCEKAGGEYLSSGSNCSCDIDNSVIYANCMKKTG